MHVLIVDRQRPEAEELARSLRLLGHEVSLASEPDEALRALDTAGFDGAIIELELAIPEGDGAGLLSTVRCHDRWRDLPVVVVAPALARDAAPRRDALAAGADEVLREPLEPASLADRLQALCRLCERAREQARREPRRAEQEMLYRLVRLAAHDLKNPLGVTQANVEYSLSRLLRAQDEDVGAALRDAEAGTRRAVSVIDDLLLLAAPAGVPLTSHREKVDLRALLRDMYRQMACAARERDVELVIDEGGDELEVLGDPRLLRRMLENLVDYALRGAPRAGRVGLLAARTPQGPTLTVGRTGRPIPPEARERLLDPAAASRPASDGVGASLGLCASRRIAQAHGSTLAIEERGEWAAAFVISMRAHASAGDADSHEPSWPLAAAG